MRCICCDASDVGLSYYNPLGKAYAKNFHLVGSDYYCDDCYQPGEEVMSDFYDQENEADEDEGAFEYDDQSVL